MRLAQHYVTLCQSIKGTSIKIYISEIANILQCTERYAKSLLKQMGAKQWLQWLPSAGRSKPSTLILVKTLEDMQQIQVQFLIEKGKTDEAMKYLKDNGWDHKQIVEILGNQMIWSRKNGVDSLSYPYYRPIRTLIPFEAATRHEGQLIQHIFNPLVRYNHRTHEFIPELIQYWQCLEDGTKWRFYVRKGVLFHNHKRLTAQTIIENFHLWQLKWSGWNQKLLKQIESIEVHSETAFTVQLTKPNYLFLHLFSDKNAMIIDTQSYRQDIRHYQWHPIGTGPYQIKKHLKDQITLHAFQNYYGYQPSLDQIHLFSLPTPPYKKRKVYFQITSEETKSTTTYETYQPELGGTFLFVNHQKKGKHQQPEFRKMLSYAIDRQQLFQNHPSHDVWFPDSLIDEHASPLRQKVNDSKAKQWFKENGFIGETIRLTSTNLAHDAYFKYELKVFRQLFKELGIHLETNIVNIEELENPEKLSQTDILISGIMVGENRLVSLLNLFTARRSFLYNTLPTHIQTVINEMVEKVISSRSTFDAYAEIRKLEAFLLEHDYMIFLYQRLISSKVVADSKLAGIELNHYSRLNYEKLWYKIE
ncbi:ABC transporter substrate-binding protein [Alkalihalobacillus pseudalcaliphilus]|uniref:ABC transporter substrate-binding protein n=1 Tax=Alkalihalobacillus pseudalcaliphilus TaxID=79884 RepID=UPI00064D9450|nr:ABC transporter substrate-binding protein [Alkalihalobacillus pseudalcaliphilus]KMK76209.1 hypothetical protein AB990_13410 [Alkalihalobacillus pseudalcaliphilus]